MLIVVRFVRLNDSKSSFSPSKKRTEFLVTPRKDYYKVLQVDPEAEPEVIAAAFRRLAAKYHPDVNPSADADQRMKEFNVAYEVLGDSARRAQYDQSRAQAKKRRGRPRGSTSQPKEPPLRKARETAMLVVTPGLLSFGTVVRGLQPSARLEIGVTGGRTLIGELHTDQPWIMLSACKLFSEACTVRVTVDTQNLQENRLHSGTITLDSVAFGSKSIPVSVRIAAPPRPVLKVHPSTLDFGTMHPGQPPKLVKLLIENAGTGLLSGEIRPKEPWLSVQQARFEHNTIATHIIAQVAGLEPGRSYTGEIEVSTNAGTGLVTAQVQVSTAPPVQAPVRTDPPTSSDLAFLHQRLGILAQMAEPTPAQALEKTVIGYLLHTCVPGTVEATLSRAVSTFSTGKEIAPSPGWNKDIIQEIMRGPKLTLDILEDLLERLRRWQEHQKP
ncbi:MAG: DnaJ domain-containing protein [Chloroflexi bacterium]|nr:DnaJ domain-containing protein [Chloroflexota bacterium]